MLLFMQCMDHTGQQNLTAFGDTGEAIMGRTADELADTQAIGEAAYEAMVQQRMNAVSMNIQLKKTDAPCIVLLSQCCSC